MKNLKSKFSMLAVVLGMGAAFATATPRAKFADHKWGRNPLNGTYTDVTGQVKGINYRCSSTTDVCTAVYPEGVNPNDQANDAYPGTAAPISVENGQFSR